MDLTKKNLKNPTRKRDLTQKKLQKPHQEERETIHTQRNGSHKKISPEKDISPKKLTKCHQEKRPHKKAGKFSPGRECQRLQGSGECWWSLASSPFSVSSWTPRSRWCYLIIFTDDTYFISIYLFIFLFIFIMNQFCFPTLRERWRQLLFISITNLFTYVSPL